MNLTLPAWPIIPAHYTELSMPKSRSRLIWTAGGLIIVVLVLFVIDPPPHKKKRVSEKKKVLRSVPVEVAAVKRGPLSFYRTFSGTISPHAQFTVAPKIGGIIKRLHVDIADKVVRGQVVIQMEDAEFVQEVVETEARLAVAEATRDETASRLEIAKRELERATTLHDRGVASDSEYDSARARILTSQAAVKVAEANLKREQAFLRAAEIRLAYTKVRAEWREGDNERIVAERFVDEGHTVAANTPILTVMEIDPVIGVIQVTEKDYPLITIGKQATIHTDAFPGKEFSGTVSQISPIFRESSRQAAMELQIVNPGQLLKPGMFIRCTMELDRAEDTVSVPESAITKRKNKLGVFKISGDGSSVKWIEVYRGFTSGDQVQLPNSELSGKVVVLGQQFLKDGSKVHIPAASTTRGGEKNP